MRFACFDCGGARAKNGQWGREMAEAARGRGHAVQVFKHDRPHDPELVFMRIAQFEPCHTPEKRAALVLVNEYNFIQDAAQFACYEDKLLQLETWGDFMPEFWYFSDRDKALDFVFSSPRERIVSKAKVGSSSHNVRILTSKRAMAHEIEMAFDGPGIPIRVGPGPSGVQRGYLLWQEFVPHNVTWRVTRVGTKMHVYRRFNYADRAVAAPASIVPTQPVDTYESEEMQSLLEFSERFFQAARTKWCAIDVLAYGDGWTVLETSLAWARGNDPAALSPFYQSEHNLMTQCELAVEEAEQGVWRAAA